MSTPHPEAHGADRQQSEAGGSGRVGPVIAVGVEDAAKAIGMSESWLWRSDIPRAKLGSRVVFLVSDLTAYVTARRSHGAAA